MQQYYQFIKILENYFKNEDCQKLFMTGGCYWFANYLCGLIPNSYLVINRIEEHCAICIDGKIYDIRGKIPGTDFHRASEREIAFMKKNYRPDFNTEWLEEYIERRIEIGEREWIKTKQNQ